MGNGAWGIKITRGKMKKRLYDLDIIHNKKRK